MDKFCRECGAQLEADMKFCANCGAAVRLNQDVEDNSDNPYSRQQMVKQESAYMPMDDNAQTGYDYAESFAAVDKDGKASDAAFQVAEPKSQLLHIPALYNFFEKFRVGRWLNHTIYVTDGRINRWAYFKNGLLCVLLNLATVIVALLACVVCFDDLTNEATAMLAMVVMIVVSLPFIPCSYMLGIRRLHDLNRPGWVVLLTLIPYVNIALSIYMLFFKGTDGTNQYGEDPLAKL